MPIIVGILVFLIYFAIIGVDYTFSTIVRNTKAWEVFIISSTPGLGFAIWVWIKSDAKLRAFTYGGDTEYEVPQYYYPEDTQEVAEAPQVKGEVMLRVEDDDPEVRSYEWKNAAEVVEKDFMYESLQFERQMVDANVDWMLRRFEELKDLGKSPSGAYLSNNIARKVDALRKKVERRKRNPSPTTQKSVPY